MSSNSHDPDDGVALEPPQPDDGLWWTLVDDELLVLDADTAEVLRLDGQTARQVADDLERASTEGGIDRRTLITGAAAIAGATWLALPGAAAASSDGPVGTGGEVTRVGDYWVHTFTTNGTFTLFAGRDVEYLVVAGGGGGGGGAGTGNRSGGGGGAGGLRHNIGSPTPLASGDHAVTVGTGGAGGRVLDIGSGAVRGYGEPGLNGSDSSLGTVATARGGGGGGGNRSGGTPAYVGRAGGSGGGAGGGTGGTSSGGTAEADQGYGGGQSGSGYGGGGGGAGGAGGAGSASGAGAAGVGLQLGIVGTEVTYAVGGPGGLFTGDTPPASSAAGSGGAGGSAGAAVGSTTKRGSDGRDGVVIVRYLAVP